MRFKLTRFEGFQECITGDDGAGWAFLKSIQIEMNCWSFCLSVIFFSVILFCHWTQGIDLVERLVYIGDVDMCVNKDTKVIKNVISFNESFKIWSLRSSINEDFWFWEKIILIHFIQIGACGTFLYIFIFSFWIWPHIYHKDQHEGTKAGNIIVEGEEKWKK